MAEPLFESFATAAPGGGSTTITINAPSGVTAGDVLVAIIIGTTGTTPPVVSATGWEHRVADAFGNNVIAVLTRLAGGSEPASYEFTYSESSSTRRGGVIRLSGAEHAISGTPSTNQGSGTTATATGITTEDDDCFLLMAVRWIANSETFAGTDQTDIFNINRLGAAYSSAPTAGATGNKTAAVADTNWQAILIAIPPAAADPNLPPAITLNTANDAETGPTPTLEFTGADPDDDDITYQIQIADNPSFEDGTILHDFLDTGGGVWIHTNPDATETAHTGAIQVDDRVGHSFMSDGGILDSIWMRFGPHETEPQLADGDTLIRFYNHQGIFGTSSAPLNPADPIDTPTPDWLAVSDSFYYNPGEFGVPEWHEYVFSGANRLRLLPDTPYVFIQDWLPHDREVDNAMTVQGDNIEGHPGNLYNDGRGAFNNGPQETWNAWFRLYVVFLRHQFDSDIDDGFENTITPADGDPFNSGDKVAFTLPQAHALEPGIYFWRVRGKDPAGTNSYGDWSETRSFTVTVSPVVVEAEAASLVLAGLQAAIDTPIVIGANVGTLSLAGQPATVAAATTVAANAGSLAVAGLPATVTAPLITAGAVGELVLAGQTAAIIAPVVVVAGAGSLALSGRTAVVFSGNDVHVQAQAGSLVLSGQTAVVGTAVTISAAAGVLALEGVAATVAAAVAVEAETAALTLVGWPAAMIDNGTDIGDVGVADAARYVVAVDDSLVFRVALDHANQP